MVRANRRRAELTRGLTAFRLAKQGVRAERWATAVRLVTAIHAMRQVTYLNRVVVRMRSTSRLISAVRTVQHRWRQKRRNRRNHFWSVHALVLQRAARRFLLLARRRRRRLASGVLLEYLRGVTRLSPTELKLRRYVHQVRIMQAFVRGFQRISSGRMILLSLQWRRLEIRRQVRDLVGTNHPNLNLSLNPAPNPNPYLNRRQVRDLVGTNHSSASAHAVLQAEAASKPRRVSKAGAHLAASSKPAVGPDGALLRGQYAGVPTQSQHLSFGVCSLTARPKSASLTSAALLWDVSSRFSGLMSRCTMRLRCM